MDGELPLEIQRDLVLKWRLSGRAAAMVGRVASRFKSSIKVGHAGETFNAKSIVGILLLAEFAHMDDVVLIGPARYLKAGSKIKITARGTDATPAMDAILDLFSRPRDPAAG